MITLTPIAQKYIRAIARQENLPEETALRLGLVPQGCEGSGTKFRYEIAFDANVAGPDDEVFESEGIQIYIDRGSLPYVDGLESMCVLSLELRRWYSGIPWRNTLAAAGTRFRTDR